MSFSKQPNIFNKKDRAAAYIRKKKSGRRTRTVNEDRVEQEAPMIFYPLISCIMPTAGRPAYVMQAIDMFMQQDYPCKELIIGFNKLSDLPAIQYPAEVKLVQMRTTVIGAKRNQCCRFALGSIIAQWDDDDMYNTNRLTMQAMPILTGEADITGLQNFVFYEAPTGNGYKADKNLFAAIYVGNVHGGSLVYNREVWSKLSMYPNLKMGEDAAFLERALKRRARLKELDGGGAFVYVRHTTNTWKFEENNFRRYEGWLPARLPAWAAKYAPFYRHMATQQNTVSTPSSFARHSPNHPNDSRGWGGEGGRASDGLNIRHQKQASLS